jgi:hypothetical protein
MHNGNCCGVDENSNDNSNDLIEIFENLKNDKI